MYEATDQKSTASEHPAGSPIRRFQQTILSQDKPILENQVPPQLPLGQDSEVPTRADSTSSPYRRWLSEPQMTYGVVPGSGG